MVASSREDVRTDLHLSFVSVRKSERLWRQRFQQQSSQPVAVTRNQQLVEQFLVFRKAVKRSEYEPGRGSFLSILG
jgi:hypothetical protein